MSGRQAGRWLTGLGFVGVGILLLPSTQTKAAWGLLGLLLAVFPANVWMAQHPERFRFAPVWALWGRLPLQTLLLWWTWQYTRRKDTDGRT